MSPSSETNKNFIVQNIPIVNRLFEIRRKNTNIKVMFRVNIITINSKLISHGAGGSFYIFRDESRIHSWNNMEHKRVSASMALLQFNLKIYFVYSYGRFGVLFS